MDKNSEKKDCVVVRNDTGEKVSGPLSEADANDLVKTKTGLTEAIKNAGLSVKKILHG